MSTAKEYAGRVYRDGRWYMIEIPEIDGLTQADSKDEVEHMAKDLIAVTLDCDISEVAVSLT